jgi:glycosyltransferase involved in cell wall biosynthesis
MENLAAQNADCVITITNGLRNELISRGVRAENIKLVPNCVDIQKHKPLQMNVDLHKKLGLIDAPTIGYIGSFVPYEGLDDLVRAALNLKKQGIRFNMLLVGEGKSYDEIRELVKRFNIEKEVIFTGLVPYDDINDYYSLVDIAAFPRKPLPVCEMVSPLKPLEAMAMGKAIVASSVNALEEMVIHGQTGLIFTKGNTYDLTEKLAQLVLDKDYLVRLGNGGLNWVRKNRTWDQAAQSIVSIYEELSREQF